MKIAIFHPWLDNIGGSEILTLELARGLNADLYTTNINLEKIRKMGFVDLLEKKKIKSIGKVPINAPFRHQLCFWKFRNLKLKDYDFYIIGADWAMSAAVNNKPNFWYVHSPLNELYEFKDYVKQNLMESWKKPLFEIWIQFNKYLNKKYLKHCQKLICNSKNTQGRIKKYYNREAIVINPPTPTNKLKPRKSKNYWLSVNRLSRPKRIEIQMKTFQNLPNEKLIIVGSYEKGSKTFESYREDIERLKPKNVEIINWVSDEELKKLYSECKGFITTAMNEDFGMTPIEAMACGKPVIASNEGGYKETILNGKTGILIDKIDSEKLKDMIIKISKQLKKNTNKYEKNCMDQAKKFDTKEFIRKIRAELR